MGSLFLVRHATTEASLAGVNLGQHDDAPLTDAGTALARRTGAAIRAELESLRHATPRIVTSPARRCRQTAAAIAGELGAEAASVEVEAGLWEIDYGQWEGLSAEECRARDPELRSRWEADPYATSTPGGESGAEVALRASAVLDALESWLSAAPQHAAMVVSHNHVVRLRLAAVLGLPMRDYRRRIQADPGSYSVVSFSSEGSVVRRMNAAPPGPDPA